MADRSPWIDWSWLKVGPVLPTEKSRKEYEEQQAQAKAQQPGPQQGPSISDYQSYRRQMEMQAQQEAMDAQRRAMAQTGPQWAADNAKANADVAAQTQAAQNGPPAPFPEQYGDWTFWDKIRNPFTEGGEEAYRKARAAEGTGLDENTPAETVIDLPANGPVPIGRPTMDENTPFQTVVPDDQTQAVPPVDPIEEIRRQKAMVDQLYPEMPPQDIGQDAIDAELDKEKQRANYLAQLAFFSGITQSAGGQWEGVGRGMAGAGQAYTSGFDRYQRALQKRADRRQDEANSRYKTDVAKSDAAIKLYSDKEDRKKGELSEARQRAKDRQSDIDEYFKERLKVSKGSDFEPTDQTKIDQMLRDWRLSRERGEIVSVEDVSDK